MRALFFFILVLFHCGGFLFIRGYSIMCLSVSHRTLSVLLNLDVVNWTLSALISAVLRLRLKPIIMMIYSNGMNERTNFFKLNTLFTCKHFLFVELHFFLFSKNKTISQAFLLQLMWLFLLNFVHCIFLSLVPVKQMNWQALC